MLGEETGTAFFLRPSSLLLLPSLTISASALLLPSPHRTALCAPPWGKHRTPPTWTRQAPRPPLPAQPSRQTVSFTLRSARPVSLIGISPSKLSMQFPNNSQGSPDSYRSEFSRKRNQSATSVWDQQSLRLSPPLQLNWYRNHTAVKEASLLCPDVINTALILLTETFCHQASHFTFHLRVRKLCVFATPRVSAAFCKAPYSGEDTRSGSRHLQVQCLLGFSRLPFSPLIESKLI